MSDERPPDDHENDRDGRAGGPPDSSAPTDDGSADEPPADDSPADADAGKPSRDAAETRREQADGGYSEKRASTEQRQREPERETAPEPEEPGEPDEPGAAEPASGGISDRIAFWLSALFGLALAVGSVALVSGRAPFFEDILRIRPTVEGGGVGADWVVGNTEPVLEALITLVHFADVIMGIFILVMVFVHWAAFRRLGARMRPPSGAQRRETAAATDGGISESGTGDGSAVDSDSAGTGDRAADDGGDRP